MFLKASEFVGSILQQSAERMRPRHLIELENIFALFALKNNLLSLQISLQKIFHEVAVIDLLLLSSQIN